MIEKSDSLMSQAEQSQKLELFISCRNLADLDLITVTDSFLIVKLIQPNRPPKQLIKTKVYNNDLNPNYAETILIDFFFQIKQRLVFEVYHEAKPPKLVGKTQTSLGQIFGSPQHGLVKDLLNNSQAKSGKIIIRCQKQEKTQKKFVAFKLSAKNLPNLKYWWFFGGTCAFFRLFRKRDKDQLLVYESEVLNYNTSPSFKEFRLSQRRLTKNDEYRNLQIRLYNYSRTGHHQLIGTATFTLNQLNKFKEFKIICNKETKGSLLFQSIKKSVQYSFTDYIQNNLQLALVTCIDFTASNGNPNQKTSLHYVEPLKKSPYQEALKEVTSILLDYDYDKLVPVYGFGAKVKHPLLDTEGKVHHCFPINGNTQNPNLYKLDQILTQYRKILKFITLSGPTKFAELMTQAMSQCKQFQRNHNQYMILFILTDGQIHDRTQVIDLLIACNRLPISIIIVGIGEGDFKIMHQLDDDDCNLVSSKGQKTERDLVQFVQFKNFKNNGVELARQVLEQLPRQVSQYYQLMGLSPADIKNTAQRVYQDQYMKMLKQNPEKFGKKSQVKLNPYQ